MPFAQLGTFAILFSSLPLLLLLTGVQCYVGLCYWQVTVLIFIS